MESYKVKIKITIRVKQRDGSEKNWEQEVTIRDVTTWAEEGNGTVAEECKLLVEVAVMQRQSYRNTVKMMVENGSIHCYVWIKGVHYPLSNEILQGSKENLIQFSRKAFPNRNKLDLCINFTYPQ